jgi:hypothetical protein
VVRGAVRPDASGFLEGLTELPEPELAALEEDALAGALLTTVREAFHQGVGGFAHDVVAQCPGPGRSTQGPSPHRSGSFTGKPTA